MRALSADAVRAVWAPGKLVWLGEYAVLDGAPAIVAGVDRQVEARAEPAEHWSIDAHNLPVPARSWPDAGERPADDPLALPAALLDLLHQRDLLRDVTPRRVVLDSSALFVDGQKVGIGSSAAILVALYRLLAKPDTSAATAFALIDAAHRACQQGLGSGIDIAAALHGGLLVFERDPRFAIAKCVPLTPPADLRFTAVFTGASTSTAQYLRKVMVWRERAGWEYTAHRDALAGLSNAGVAALETGDAGEFCRVAKTYGEVLEAFGKAAGVDIFSAIHRQLRDIGDELGVTYKTSGAGGRDLGIAFATDPDALTIFSRRASELPECRSLDLGLATAAALN